jgi:hypothetical protein
MPCQSVPNTACLLLGQALQAEVMAGWPVNVSKKGSGGGSEASSFSKFLVRSPQLHSHPRGKLKIKFKLLKTGPRLLPVGREIHSWRVQ